MDSKMQKRKKTCLIDSHFFAFFCFSTGFCSFSLFNWDLQYFGTIEKNVADVPVSATWSTRNCFRDDFRKSLRKTYQKVSKYLQNQQVWRHHHQTSSTCRLLHEPNPRNDLMSWIFLYGSKPLVMCSIRCYCYRDLKGILKFKFFRSGKLGEDTHHLQSRKVLSWFPSRPVSRSSSAASYFPWPTEQHPLVPWTLSALESFFVATLVCKDQKRQSLLEIWCLSEF